METITKKSSKEEAEKESLSREISGKEKNKLDEEKYTSSQKWVPVRDMDEGDQDY